jgi:glycosyltransferase involved in cell wall biosynthesis
MRILHVNNMNQVAQIYGSGLSQRGHAVTIYEPSFVGAHAPLPLKLAMMPWRVLDMRHIVDKLNSRYFDIVHIHWASYGVLGLASRIPFVVYCRGDDVRDRLKQPFFRLLLTPILRRAAAVMCSTPDLLPVVQAVRPDVLFFPAPIDTDRFAPGEGDHCCPPRPWTVLLFASLDLNKGADVATQGIARFVKRHPGVRVQLLDCGALRDRYKRQYSERFEFIPLVAPDKVEHLIRPADVIVGQFALGALGLAELEAMSCAKPVICSFRYKEAYSTPPPVFQATTAREIDEHLENLFQHPEVGASYGQSAREWVIKNHNHRTLSARLEVLYQSILELPVQRTSYSI